MGNILPRRPGSLLHALLKEDLLVVDLMQRKGCERGVRRHMNSTGGAEINQEHESADRAVIADKIEKLYVAFKSLDYYGILNVDRGATTDEIKRAYHRLAKEFHPDRYLHLESDPLKEKLHAIFSYINEAYRELTSASGVPKSAPHPNRKTAPRESSKNLAKVRFSEGKRVFDAGHHEEASTLFGQAIYLDNSVAQYHYYYGMSLIGGKKIKPAEEALKRASQLDPDNSAYIAELGHIYLGLGFMTRARNTFEKALKRNPADQRALEGIEKLTD